jgi:hypothetical protein
MTMAGLACCPAGLRRLGRAMRGAALLGASLVGVAAAGRSDHPSTLTSRNNLGAACRAAGQAE